MGEGDPEKHKAVKSPRPGHADLAGALKYNLPEARYILERASARETAARVAAGAVAKQVLAALDIEVLSHVIQVGGARLSRAVSFDELRGLAAKDEVLLNCADEESEQRMKAEVDEVCANGDTVGGIFEVVAHNVPPGLGTYANWDERLDGKLAAAVMSIQAVKAVEIGDGVLAAASSWLARRRTRLAMRASDRRERQERCIQSSRISPVRAIMPVAWKAASRMVATSWFAGI